MTTIRKVLHNMVTNKQWLKALGVIVLAFVCYLVFPESAGEGARRMVFIFVFAALFWALEIVPLYATSFLVVLLEVFLLARPGGVLGMEPSGYKTFLLPFGSPIIMLFLGGLTIASALHKYKVDHFIAEKLIALFGNKPYFIMCGFMVTTAFLSMWMSNTATTAMMISMITPVLGHINHDDPYKKGIVLSIPFAANIGGIGTPVGTPPNAIALGILADYGINLSFTSWMLMAIPLVVILLFLASVVIYFLFPPKNKEFNLHLKLEEPLTHEAKLSGAIAVVTVLLWLTSSFHKLPSAVVALTAVCLFFSFHLLKQDDFKRIDWDVLVLMWGGLSLGKGLGVSGLTEWIVQLPVFDQTGIILVISFSILGLFVSTFMSHTATANLLIPIVLAIPGQNIIFLAVTIALACSFAMALPISTPPNAIAFSTNALRINDMLKAGAIISVIAFALLMMGFQFFITKAFGL